MLIPILALMITGKFTVMSYDARNAIALSLVTAVAFINLVYLCLPFTKWRVLVISFIFGLLALGIPGSIFLLNDQLFHLMPLHEDLTTFFIMLGASAVVTVVIQTFRVQIEKIFAKRIEAIEEAQKSLENTKKK